MKYLAAILIVLGIGIVSSEMAEAKSPKKQRNGHNRTASYERPEHSSRYDGSPSDYRFGFGSRANGREIRLFFERIGSGGGAD